MSVPFWVVPLLAALVAPIAYANGSNLFGLPAREETKDKIIKRSALHVPRWKKWLIAEEHGIKNSGDIWYELSLREEDGTISTRFPSLVGPYRLSPVNQQIFACESNVMNDAKEALIIDMKGVISHKVVHQGFFRTCGLTDDKKLYWLEYSDSDDGKVAWSNIVVVDKLGQIVNKSVLKKAGNVLFTYEGKTYRLSFSTPVLPG